jgi:hypothetical protein
MPLAAPVISQHPFAREIMGMVRAYDANRPRSLQQFLGPSEIGAPCDRQIAMKLAGVVEVNETADPWFPIIGSAVHAWLADAVVWYNDVYLARPTNPRFLVENRVKVTAKPGGYDTSGHTDVYDADYKRVIDWKIVGTSTMRKVKNGATPEEQAGPQYTVQANTYGRGWVEAGYEVGELLICFLPRSNFLKNMQIVRLPFQPELSEKALARVAAINQLRHLIPPHEFPAGGCSVWCPFYRPSYPLGATSCPGHGEAKDD